LVQNQTTSDAWQQLLEMPRKSWWARLPFGVRMTAGASALLVAIGGGAAGIAALTKADEPAAATAAGREPAAVAVGAAPIPATEERKDAGKPAATRPPVVAMGRREMPDEADRTATRAPRPPAPPKKTAPPAAPAQPQVTTQTVTETRAIPFGTQLVRDPSLPRGRQRVQSEGIAGEQTLRYLVTYTGGKETSRQLLGSSTTRPPQPRVIAFGTQGHGKRHRECGPGWHNCLPLGRNACPHEDQVEESGAVQLGGSLDVMDQPLLDGLALDPGLTC
jgi:hypothetical protein